MLCSKNMIRREASATGDIVSSSFVTLQVSNTCLGVICQISKLITAVSFFSPQGHFSKMTCSLTCGMWPHYSPRCLVHVIAEHLFSERGTVCLIGTVTSTFLRTAIRVSYPFFWDTFLFRIHQILAQRDFADRGFDHSFTHSFPSLSYGTSSSRLNSPHCAI